MNALHLLKRRGLKVIVACVGNTSPPNHPDFFGKLMAQRSAQGLEEQFVLLGLVPRDALFRLLRQSVAVLNPSLFEGFGLSLAESRFVGKQALVSDLPVFREHQHPALTYFDPRNAEELADKMASCWEQGSAGATLELEEIARRDHPRAQLHFANAFLDVAKEAL